jgi:hypothetical protein
LHLLNQHNKCTFPAIDSPSKYRAAGFNAPLIATGFLLSSPLKAISISAFPATNPKRFYVLNILPYLHCSVKLNIGVSALFGQSEKKSYQVLNGSFPNW